MSQLGQSTCSWLLNPHRIFFLVLWGYNYCVFQKTFFFVLQCLLKIANYILIILTKNLTIFRPPHIYNLTYTLSHTCIIIHIYTQTHINAHTCTNMHNQTHKNIPTHTLTYTYHTHTHSCICTHTNKKIFLLLWNSL